jgi:tetratricopeptide (TPR) repeat protein/predicted Ser/Thr protein kinase
MIGKTILHYTVVEEIGRGGMGIVYKAKDTKLQRTVALKFLPPAVGPDERARFEVEAQSVAHLQHPNICGIHEINEIDGQTFIVMPFFDGNDLKQLTAAGPMEFSNAVDAAIQVASALQEAHEHGIIHRDIKSANVMITKKSLVKVMDFGLAKRQGSTQITQAGASLGTADYMSPEQAAGDTVDHRTDIWSLGVVLYEMLTGETPFRGEFGQAVIYSILNQDPPPLSEARPDAPALLVDIVACALAKKPDDRYQSADEMIADLREVQLDVGAPAGTTGSASTATRSPSTGSRARRTTARGITGEASFSQRLVQRRVPLVLGVYVVLAAVIVIALRWSVNHFPISPHLPAFIFAALAALLPVVLVLVYDRGRHAVSKIGIPIYLIAATGALVGAFEDRYLGAATETVRVTDEAGNIIERALPKGQFRKRFALFYLDNEAGDPSLDWMSYGLSQLLRYELNQDTYVSYGLGFTHAHREAGYDKPVGSPLTLKREFANRFHYPRFVVGSFDREGDEFVVDIALYGTETGRPLTERRYRGENVFILIDTMSVQLRRDLEVPEYHISENTDLPVAEMFTSSPEAVMHYVNGVNAIWQDNDYKRAVAELDRAIEIDPAFAMAHWLLYGAHTSLNDGDKAQEAIRLALQHKYRLPESEQFALMNDYYEQQQDAEGMYENARRWAALHPEAAGAHEALADHYEQVNEFDAAITERKILFDIDPQRYWELHRIGDLYEKADDDDEALWYYQEYATLHPDKYDSFTTIGSFYRRRGDYDNARDYYKKALLIDPERMATRTELAEIERHTGNFEASLQQCEDSLERARTSSDSTTALWQLVEYHAFRGEAEKALRYQIAALDLMGRTTSPIQVIIVKLFTLATYVDAGRFDEAIAIARAIEDEAGVPFIKPMISAGFIITYACNEDPSYLPEVEKYTDRFEEWMKATRSENFQWALEYCKTLVEFWRGNHAAALERIKSGLEAIPPDQVDNKVWMLTSAVEIARELEDYAEAHQFLDQLFELEPFSPEGHLEAARIYHAQGRTQEAIEHLKKALQVWENADPQHPRARRARELAEQLRISS